MRKATSRATTLKTTLLHSEPGNELILAVITEMLQRSECQTRAAAVRLMLYESAKQRLGISLPRGGAELRATTAALTECQSRTHINQSAEENAVALERPAVRVLELAKRDTLDAASPTQATGGGAPAGDRIRRLRAMGVSEDIDGAQVID